MSAPAPLYRCFTPQSRPIRSTNRFGMVSFTLGLLVAFAAVVYATWLGVAGLAAVEGLAQHIGASVTAEHVSAAAPIAPRPPAPPLLPPTPSGATMAFDQLWTGTDGNTIVAGVPTVGTSVETGESVIAVPLTLTNNGERDWNPESSTFVGKLNRATVPESAEGDLMYRTPIVAHTSVTLTKIFVAGPGQFALIANTPHGVALFSGQV
ncbi:MAG: hypothetical protein WAK86_12925 [Pseudonocardiaceae bacterium]